ERHALEFYAVLHRWAMAKRSGLPLRFWRSSFPGLGAPFLIVALALFGAMFSPSSEATLKSKGRELVAQGISDQNRDEALRLILALQSEYSGETATTAPRMTRIAVVIAALTFVGVILLLPPKIVIGLGAGEQRLAFWRGWLRLLFVLFPSAI